MTSRERIRRIFRREPTDRIGAHESFWTETVRRWTAEGHLREGEDVGERFGLDITQTRPLNLVADLAFGRQVIEQTPTYALLKDGNGAILRKELPAGGAPRYVDFTVRERRDWEERVKPLLAPSPKRIALDAYRRDLEAARRAERFCFLGNRLIFQTIEMVCGHEHMLAGMALDPDWARDMADTYARLLVGLLGIAFREVGKPDGLWFNEDLGFKERPFLSPAMYDAILRPAHEKVFAWVHAQGLPIVVHSCGFVEPLLPSLIEAGMDCLQVMEVKAGMDAVRIKREHGDRIVLCGGLDARALIANDRDAIRRELAEKLPALARGGGYILHSDHSITPQVSYETYRFFLEEGRRLGTF